MLEVKILKSEEFDKLPRSVTKGSDVTQYLGFADPETGKAYVRHTAIPELNQYLVSHEAEHLLTSPHTHRDSNGLCCKSFGDFFNTIGKFSWNPGGIFGGGSKPPEQQSPQSAQMQAPQQSQRVNIPSRPQTAAGGALGAFGGGAGSGNVPESVAGSIVGRLGGPINQGLNSVDPDEERAKGNYSGRFNF